MKKLLTTVGISAAMTLSLSAADVLVPLKTKTDLNKLTANSKELAGLKYETIYLYPQTTVRGNDAEANKKFDSASAVKAEVAILANERELGIVVKWADTTNSSQLQKSVKAFGDAVAIQIPQNCTDAKTLPYIGMGSEGRPVTIMLQKNTEGTYVATEADITNQQAKNNLNLFNDELKKKQDAVAKSINSKYQKVFVAEGFRTTTEVKESLNYKMDMQYNAGKWTAVFTKPLRDDYSKSCDAEPIAFAIWDGAKDGRNGIKWLSSWKPIQIKVSDKSKEAIATITEKVKGNVANGKKLAADNCVACHTMGEAKAPEGMAPNLNNIGGYSTAAYLRESILSPHAVVVPGLNVNQKPAMQFYSVDSSGKRTSNMPAFDFMKPAEIEDLVAYLQTLKVGGPK